MGFTLHGYRITRQIGTGAGSRIYLAVHLESNHPVAVKRVIRGSADDDPFLAQVENEFEISSKIDNRHIRRGLELHRVRKMLQVRELVLVMEHVDGLTLESARPNRLDTFLALFQKVATGLHAMHEHGYIHTDIKPNNIMIARGGVVKIIDFGQSCPIGHRKERIQGTPDFIAPEQVRRLQLDRRTDVFNLGATMYWVLTSERYPTALPQGAAGGEFHLVPSTKAVEPIELNDKIPRSLSNLVMECCKDNPDARPVDMTMLISRLDTIRKLWRQQRENMREKLRVVRPGDSNDAPVSSGAIEDNPAGNEDTNG